MFMASTLLKELAQRLEPYLDQEVLQRIDSIPRENLNEFGVDPFGFDPDTLKLAVPIAVWLYRHYFRCQVYGLEHIPKGRMLVVANHSGQLPFDAFMIGASFLLEGDPPRLLRAMAERWSAELPFVSTILVRAGQIVGDPASCKRLLELNEAVLVFPEGVQGIIKLFSKRYQLTDFGQGFMRLALKTKAPIVPVALVGAEEQAPSIANLSSLGKVFGFPALPLVLPQIIPLPLPVKYHIHIGDPMHFRGDGTEDDQVIAERVQQVKERIQGMLNDGLRKRHSVFF